MLEKRFDFYSRHLIFFQHCSRSVIFKQGTWWRVFHDLFWIGVRTTSHYRADENIIVIHYYPKTKSMICDAAKSFLFRLHYSVQNKTMFCYPTILVIKRFLSFVLISSPSLTLQGFNLPPRGGQCYQRINDSY